MIHRTILPFFFFFNDTATTEIYTLSLHDALPILRGDVHVHAHVNVLELRVHQGVVNPRSEEHTSELQSQSNLVCRLLLEKKKKAQVILEAGAHNPMHKSDHYPGG